MCIRDRIGLVPQEITLDLFETVENCVKFTRGLYGKEPDPEYVEQVLRSLALWDKRNAMTKELSGGMKRRVLIAKALAHRPRVLFLDEPTAGVDVTLRREMWQVVRKLREDGVTIILTTHYLEEAEEMADRIGVISKGQLQLVRPKAELMGEFGHKTLTIELDKPLDALPESLLNRDLKLSDDCQSISYDYESRAGRSGIGRLLADLSAAGVSVRDVSTRQSSLEDVFLNLLEEKA